MAQASLLRGCGDPDCRGCCAGLMVVVESIQPTGGRQHALGPARLGAKTAICVVYGRTDGRTNIRPPPPLATAFRECTIDRAATQRQRASTRGQRRWQRGSTCAANRDVNSYALPGARWRLDCRPRERARWCVYRVAARRATNAATRRPAGVRAVSASRDGGRLFTDPVDAAPGALACATRGHTHGSAGLRSLAVSMSTRGLLAPRTLHSTS
jgi:hypothetical protein